MKWKANELPDQKYLHEMFIEHDGILYWAKNKQRIIAGQVAGGTTDRGYCKIGLDGGYYFRHRLIYVMHHGECPTDKEVDHINRDRGDDSIENLRLASHTENSWNKRTPKNNTSGVCGVYWHKLSNKWLAHIEVNRKAIYLGTFTEIAEAKQARMEAELKYGFV